MHAQTCRECSAYIETKTKKCPQCGAPKPLTMSWKGSGCDIKSKTSVFGIPLVHIAFGRQSNGSIRVAKGIIAIGQFAIGVITFAQFGIGLIFGLGQFLIGYIVIAQFAGAFYFGVGQIATGYIAIGQIVIAHYGLCQIGKGAYLWSQREQNPEAVEYFKSLWLTVKSYMSFLINK